MVVGKRGKDNSKSEKEIKSERKERKKEVVKFAHPEHPIVQKKINKSLNLSIKEGSYAALMNGFGPSYFVPYALALNASSSQIGFLNALISLLPNLTQLRASRLLEKFKRKTVTYWAALVQNLFFILIMGLGILYLLEIQVSYFIPLLIVAISLFYAIGAIGGPAWFSWMGSLVPEDSRGRYFARRNEITGFFGLVALVLGGILLDYFEKKGVIEFAGFNLNLVIAGFLILFLLAFIFRMISLRMLRKQYEPIIKIRKKDHMSLRGFIVNLLVTPFGRFTGFSSILRIAVSIGSPFIAVYMLSKQGLGLPYLWFMIITVSGVLYHLLFYKGLGRIADKFGNISLIRVCSILLAITPLLWILSIYITGGFMWTILYLIFVPQLIAGFGWAGFTLASTNYIYDSLNQEKQGFGVAYFNLFNGIGMFIGAGLGSLLALANIVIFGSSLLFIFLVSGIVGLIVALSLTKYLREVRHVKNFKYQFIIQEFHPTYGLVREMHKFDHFRSKVLHYL
jgi:MFS family permease